MLSLLVHVPVDDRNCWYLFWKWRIYLHYYGAILAPTTDAQQHHLHHYRRRQCHSTKICSVLLLFQWSSNRWWKEGPRTKEKKTYPTNPESIIGKCLGWPHTSGLQMFPIEMYTVNDWWFKYIPASTPQARQFELRIRFVNEWTKKIIYIMVHWVSYRQMSVHSMDLRLNLKLLRNSNKINKRLTICYLQFANLINMSHPIASCQDNCQVRKIKIKTK